MKINIHRFKRTFAATAGCCALSMIAAAPAHAATMFGQLGILDTSGINPTTHQPWQLGDHYRLVFITSDRVNASDNSGGTVDWNDISTWNATAQGFANNATGHDLSSVNWNVIGSTVDVDARDNTLTNPNINGSGHPIMLIDGSTVVASDFNELWSGAGIQNIINLTENEGQSISDAPAIPWPLTGTRWNGTAHVATGVLRDISGGGSIRQGEGGNTVGWIDRAESSVIADSSNPHAIYAMSETLTVIPEPSTAVLIGLGSLVLLRRRR